MRLTCLPGDGDRTHGRRGLRPGPDERAHRRGDEHAARRRRQGVVLLRLCLHVFRPRRPRTTCNPPSRRTAAGCTSKHATTTKRSTRARRGSATISAAAKNWRGNSRRCSAACLATPPASRRATKARWAGGSSNSTARASTSSTRGSTSDSFFYNWSELTLAPVEWFRFGLVTQRTRVYKTDRDIQRGVLAGFSFKKVSLTGYVLNPDDDKPTFVLAVGLTF